MDFVFGGGLLIFFLLTWALANGCRALGERA